MEYTSSSNKGMSMSEYDHRASNNNSCATRKIEIVDEEGGGKSGREKAVIEREHMFDKVVTPSDVGKLNRLVIPKQHAEKYFPLDSSKNEKDLVLNFEDRMGKPWRFRYSYWNSSQSYVMTKGWSRFVKEKKLDAGDIVSFHRGIGEFGKDKLFIDWSPRPDASALLPQHHHQHQHQHHGRPIGIPYPYYPYSPCLWDHHQSGPHLSTMTLMNVVPSQSYPLPRGMGGGGGGSGSTNYGFGFGNVVNPYPVTRSLIFVRSSSSASSTSCSVLGGGGGGERERSMMMMQQQQEEVHREVGGVKPMVYESVPVVQGKAAAKRVRLFGVNMDCPISHQTHDFDILSSSLPSSSTANPNHNQHHQHHTQAISMGPPSSSSSSPSSQPFQLRSSSFYHATSSSSSSHKGKSSTTSSMSFDLDI